MTREIKFRIWQKKTQKMHYPHQNKGFLQFDGTGVSFNDDLGYVDQGVYELMQYTGLKDENGKEIYEGDIVRFDFDYFNKFALIYGDVYYKNACFYINDGCPAGNLGLGHLIENKRNVQIIGNIYENPELLKEKNV